MLQKLHQLSARPTPSPGKPTRKKRLGFESLEPRRVMTIIVDAISNLTVDEGSTAIVAADFVDSSPGGDYSGTIRFENSVTETANFTQRPTGSNGSLQITFDYRFDTSGFFNSQRRAIMDTAAELVAGRMNDQLAGFTSSGQDQFTASFLNPSTGALVELPGFSVGRNELIVFLGARDLPGNSLANAGSGGGSAPQTFFDFATSRGQIGVPQVDFAPWGGAMSFDTEANWHDEFSSEGLGGNENDLLSVAVHELGHVLGFTEGVESFRRWISNGRFTGPASTAEYDGTGSPPLDDDPSHWQEGLQDDGRETVFDPSVTRGRRKLMTELDFAGLDDLGWELRDRNVNGIATNSHVYSDNGQFSGLVRVVNGAESGTRNFTVNVRNVAPTIPVFTAPTGRAGTSINLTAAFTDPGSADTHIAAIAWGDGTGQQDLTVNQSARTFSGSHVYSQPGTYTATVGVQDDDGAQTTREFTIVVSAPPRGDWQNPNLAEDVNANGVVDPLDALLVINELNDRQFSNPTTGVLPPAPANLMAFLDVTGDDIVAPQDALRVINVLPSSSAIRSASSASVVASSTSLVVPTSENARSSEPVDEAFADFSMSWLETESALS